MKPKAGFEPHLAINEMLLSQGNEWQPQFRGWCLLHIVSGIGYWQDPGGTREVPAGSTLVFSAEARGVLRASQLNELAITYFCVETEKLSGLLSLGEQNFLKQIAARKNLALRVVPTDSPISARLKNFQSAAGAGTTSTRLRLLQLFMDAFGCELNQETGPVGAETDGRGRLRQLLAQMAASEFVELSMSDLAPMVSCSPRHLNRLFREEVGATFREKQIELRLARACELLSTSNAKVVDVALESGYQSSSVFSELFKKRFGMSPGRWRRQGVKSVAAPRILL